jgi:PDZ domain-containing protein
VTGGDHETASVPEAPAGGSPGEGAPRRRRRLRGRVLYGIVLLIVIAAVIARQISLPYYALTPGKAESVLPHIEVPADRAHTHPGDVLLTDVNLTQVNALNYLYFKLNSSASVYPTATVTGGLPVAEYDVEGTVDMSDAIQAATVVGLRESGYPVTVHPDGALVYATFPGSPAFTTLAVGDVIVSADSHTVDTPAQLSDATHGLDPGATVHLGVERGPHHKPKQVALVLGEYHLKGHGTTATTVCLAYGSGSTLPAVKVNGGSSCIGVYLYSHFAVEPPFKVVIHADGIVGPSAGLAYTLGLIAKLDPYDLTGGLRVAATGTMSVTGAVGAIGGVPQKTVAVENAGAKVFFVPRDNYPAAKAKASSGLKVMAVANIDQALADLIRLGGRLPPGAPRSAPR